MRAGSLSPILAWRLAERRSTAVVDAAVSGARIRLPADHELINLIATRRYLASYVVVETDVTLNSAFARIQAALSK